mmetsp:Transcript_6490/g.16711  ORF Transcript_6490/g.16711 Transcript_6490/m.16711 type:complete len:242 (+) Transcript_6490:16-741(+)
MKPSECCMLYYTIGMLCHAMPCHSHTRLILRRSSEWRACVRVPPKAERYGKSWRLLVARNLLPSLNFLNDVLDVLEVEESVVLILLLVESGLGFVDADVVRQLAVRLETSGLVGVVLEDDVGLLVLKVPQSDQDDVSGADPHLLPHLAADVCKPLDAVDALGVQAAVSEHPDDLRVLLAILLEDKLALLLSLVLPPPPVLSSLSFVLRHTCGAGGPLSPLSLSVRWSDGSAALVLGAFAIS